MNNMKFRIYYIMIIILTAIGYMDCMVHNSELVLYKCYTYIKNIYKGLMNDSPKAPWCLTLTIRQSFKRTIFISIYNFYSVIKSFINLKIDVKFYLIYLSTIQKLFHRYYFIIIKVIDYVP